MTRLPGAESTLPHLGEAAALGAAAFWAIAPLFFTAAGRRIGSFQVNQIRTFLACVFLGGIALVVPGGGPITTERAWMLAVSGVVGLSLGDGALFQALVLIGPRRVILLMSLAPVFVALLGVPLLGETLTPVGIAGMALTLGGIAWVVSERMPEAEVHGSVRWGVVLGVAAAVGQAVGSLFAKAGMGFAGPGSVLARLADGGTAADLEPVTPLVGSLVRMVTALVALVAFGIATGRMRRLGPALANRKGLAQTCGGAVFGPTLGVWMSLVAFAHTDIAVAQTIIAFAPVLVIVLAWVVHRERTSPRGLFGALVATAGIGVLAFRESIAGLL